MKYRQVYKTGFTPTVHCDELCCQSQNADQQYSSACSSVAVKSQIKRLILCPVYQLIMCHSWLVTLNTVSVSVNDRYCRHMQSSQSRDWSWISPFSANFITSSARLTVSQWCIAVVVNPCWLKRGTRGPQRRTWRMATMSVICGPLPLWSREDKWSSPLLYEDTVWAEPGLFSRQNWIKVPIWTLMELVAWGTETAVDCGFSTTRGEPCVLHNIWIVPVSFGVSHFICSLLVLKACPLLGHTRRISWGMSSAAVALLLYRWCEPINICSSKTHNCLS